MTDPRNIIVWVLAGLLALVSVIAGTQILAKQAEQAAHYKTKQQHAEVLRDLAERTAKAAIAAQKSQAATQAAVAALDTKRTQELTNDIADNNRRRTADSSGAQRLRIPATCPARPVPATDLPSPAPAASVDPAPAEVPAAFRQELWDIRQALIEERAQLLALQDYVKAIQGAP